jgi:putative glutamine amidotransferase
MSKQDLSIRIVLSAVDQATSPIEALGRTVNSFHASAITEESLGERLAVVAFAPDGTIEAVRHRQLPWMGIMWHPEREAPFSEDDRELVTDLFLRSRFPEAIGNS